LAFYDSFLGSNIECIHSSPIATRKQGNGALETISLKSKVPKGKQRNFRDFGVLEVTEQQICFVEKRENKLQTNNL
jgi:hypothetical protein